MSDLDLKNECMEDAEIDITRYSNSELTQIREAMRMYAERKLKLFAIPDVSGSLDNIYLFKVSDFTTILLGRLEDDKYFVQRGDGTRYEYDEDRIVWKRKLNCH